MRRKDIELEGPHCGRDPERPPDKFPEMLPDKVGAVGAGSRAGQRDSGWFGRTRRREAIGGKRKQMALA